MIEINLQSKQSEVTELLAGADDLAKKEETYQEVYAAMAASLGEAWKDLNAQLDFRMMLLNQSIAFHQSAEQVPHFPYYPPPGGPAIRWAANNPRSIIHLVNF